MRKETQKRGREGTWMGRRKEEREEEKDGKKRGKEEEQNGWREVQRRGKGMEVRVGK